MAHKGTHWRHHQKFLKVLELYSFQQTWEFKVLKTIHRDMRMIRCTRLWPFTSYSPYPHLKSIPGDMSDVSPDELRYLKYTSSEEEYVAYEKVLGEDYQYMRNRLRRDMRHIRRDAEDVCDDADKLMMYLVK